MGETTTEQKLDSNVVFEWNAHWKLTKPNQKCKGEERECKVGRKGTK